MMDFMKKYWEKVKPFFCKIIKTARCCGCLVLQKTKPYYRFARRQVALNPDNILWHAFFVLVAIFLFTMFFTAQGGLFGWLVGAGNKKDTLEFVGFGIGGIIAVLGALATNFIIWRRITRTKILEKMFLIFCARICGILQVKILTGKRWEKTRKRKQKRGKNLLKK